MGDGTNYKYIIMGERSFKNSTKYGLLFNMVTNTVSGSNFWFDNNNYLLGGKTWSSLDGVGNKKHVFTTGTITNNSVQFTLNPQAVGNTAKISDIRIYELPTGSQIESDFNTLTADQLNTKYPFYDLCLPYWKRIVDGAEMTSTLPTGSYTGYTPYKMMYEYATPIVTTYPSQAKDPKTFYPSTEIVGCEKSEVKPTIMATVKRIGL